MGLGSINPAYGAVVGLVAISANTAYGFNAEMEKDILREEYRRWKNEVKNE